MGGFVYCFSRRRRVGRAIGGVVAPRSTRNWFRTLVSVVSVWRNINEQNDTQTAACCALEFFLVCYSPLANQGSTGRPPGSEDARRGSQSTPPPGTQTNRFRGVPVVEWSSPRRRLRAAPRPKSTFMACTLEMSRQCKRAAGNSPCIKRGPRCGRCQCAPYEEKSCNAWKTRPGNISPSPSTRRRPLRVVVVEEGSTMITHRATRILNK